MIYKFHLDRKVYLHHPVIYVGREFTEDIVCFENEDMSIRDVFLNLHGFFHTYYEKIIFFITLEDMGYKNGFMPCELHNECINGLISWKNINSFAYTNDTLDIVFPENSNKFLTKICEENNIECKNGQTVNFWIKIERDMKSVES